MKKQTIRMYIPPTLQSQKVTVNLKLILLVKILNQKKKKKKKTNEILPAAMEKIKLCLFKKIDWCSFRL